MSGFTIRKLTPPLYCLGAGYFSPKLRQVGRIVPGLEWSGSYRGLVGHIDAVEVGAQVLQKMKLRIDEASLDALKEARFDYRHNLPASYIRSREYQKTGIDFLISRSGAGALLADDMSLGKGHQSLRAARAFRGRTLIVCPAHVRGVWERPPSPGDEEGGEVCKWWPDAFKRGVATPYGITPSAIDEDALVCVIHYDILTAWTDALREWKPETGILDEGQACQGETSQRSKALRAILEGCSHRMALTGTPPTDKPADFWNLLDILSPRAWGRFFDYGRRYCDGRQQEIVARGNIKKVVWNFDGRSNLDELRQRLEWMTLRREKSDVAKQMPPKTREIIDVEVNIRAKGLPSFEMIKKTSAMRKSLDLAADAKHPHTINLVKSHLAQEKKVVCFTWRREIADRIAQEAGTKNVEVVYGGVAHAKRSLRINNIKNAKGPGLLACTIESCGSGIDFSWGDVGVFAELIWKPRDLLQAEDRLYRLDKDGNLWPVLIQYVIARGTSDELILAGVIRKLDTRDAIIGKGNDGLKDDLSDDDVDGESYKAMCDALRALGEPEEKPKKKRKSA